MEKANKPSVLWFFGSRVKFHVEKAQNNDGLSLMESRMPHGFAPPFHVHHDEEETIYVVEGEIHFQIGSRVQIAKSGEAVFLPNGVPHGFRVVSPSGARTLTMTRGGFEHMVRSVSFPVNSDGSPATASANSMGLARLKEAGQENRIEVLGPPLAAEPGRPPSLEASTGGP